MSDASAAIFIGQEQSIQDADDFMSNNNGIHLLLTEANNNQISLSLKIRDSYGTEKKLISLQRLNCPRRSKSELYKVELKYSYSNWSLRLQSPQGGACLHKSIPGVNLPASDNMRNPRSIGVRLAGWNRTPSSNCIRYDNFKLRTN